MNNKTRFLFILAGCLSAGLFAGELKFTGYSGNSGTAERPVRFGKAQRGDGHGNQTQCLPVYDPASGRIYMSAGEGTLNAYTLDGRLAASYEIPKGYFSVNGDPLTRCGEKLYFRRGPRIWELPLNAPDGAKAVRSNHPLTASGAAKNGVRLISSSSRNGRIAVLRKNGALSLYDPVSGREENAGTLENAARINVLDWNEDGELFAIIGKTAHKLENGRFVKDSEWPKTVIGRAHPVMNGRFIGGHFYGSGWGGTVTRLNGKTLEADPGVILGGRSGYFIGYVFVDPELEIPAGTAEISPGIFAVGGKQGAIVLAKWNRDTGKLERLRRIGAVPDVKTLELDSAGRMLAGGVIRGWNDSELAPSSGGAGVEPLASARFGADDIIVFGSRWNQFAVSAGALADGKRPALMRKEIKPFSSPAGAAVYRNNRNLTALLLDFSGKTIAGELYYNENRIQFKRIPDVRLKTSAPVSSYSGLAMPDAETLLAAADGGIVVFKPDGSDWKEVSRWTLKFEPGCRIAADGGRVCISEKGKNLLSVYSPDGKTLLAKTAVPSPGAVALNGRRVAVHESDHQRISKYELEN